MQEICEALEEMERRQREAELRRIAEQSTEWIKDFVPSGPAEFGAEPVFRSDFHIDPEEARAAAACRKESRMQSRESSMPRLEEIGKKYIITVMLVMVHGRTPIRFTFNIH